jgi:hypothetical protein
MLELGSSGSVRGVSSNGHPYRDPGTQNRRSQFLSERFSRVGKRAFAAMHRGERGAGHGCGMWRVGDDRAS